MSNEKCCEAIAKEVCCDDKNIVNIYFGKNSCRTECLGGSASDGGSGTYDHDQLENKNLGIQHDASAIGFEDGETFQEKYDKGELTGPQGLDAYETWKSLDPENNTATFEEWVSSMIRQSAIRCRGIIQSRALPASSTTQMTPVVQEGNASLCSGNKLVAPVSGLYVFSVGSAQLPTTHTGYSYINKIDINGSSINMGVAQVTNTKDTSSISRILWLNKDEGVVFYMYSDVAQSSIASSNRAFDFEFALISSQGADPIAFQTLQDEVSSLKETVQELRAAIES